MKKVAVLAAASAAAFPSDTGSLTPVWALHLHTATDVGRSNADKRLMISVLWAIGFPVDVRKPRFFSIMRGNHDIRYRHIESQYVL